MRPIDGFVRRSQFVEYRNISYQNNRIFGYVDHEVPPTQPAKSQPAKRSHSSTATKSRASTRNGGVKTEPMDEEEEVEVKPAKSAKKTKSQGPSGGPGETTLPVIHPF